MGQKNKKLSGTFKLNDPLMKALKAVNSLSGKSVREADLKRHRAAVEWAGHLAAPKGDVTVTTFAVGDIPCDAVRPEFAYNPRYAILYAHGGGYICGGLEYSRILASKMATGCGFTTYSFAYRLAPENPYPAALEDGMAVWDHLTGMYEPDHILIAGDSAGGNLALCMVQKLLAEKRGIPKAMLLFSPWADMTGTAESYEINKDVDPILTGDYVMDAARAYMTDAGDPHKPEFSPLFGDFKGFPPVYIMAGRNEILLDDSIRLKERISESGGKAELDIEENGWHVYQQMPIPIAERAMKRLSAYVSEEIYGK